MPQQTIPAADRVCLADTAVLQQGLRRAFPLDMQAPFEELLAAIDAAEEQTARPAMPCGSVDSSK
jgi:hypothetical protein